MSKLAFTCTREGTYRMVSTRTGFAPYSKLNPRVFSCVNPRNPLCLMCVEQAYLKMARSKMSLSTVKTDCPDILERRVRAQVNVDHRWYAGLVSSSKISHPRESNTSATSSMKFPLY